MADPSLGTFRAMVSGCLTVVSAVVTRAPLAQLDRAAGYEPVGRGFESLRAHFGILKEREAKHHPEVSGDAVRRGKETRLIIYMSLFHREQP